MNLAVKRLCLVPCMVVLSSTQTLADVSVADSNSTSIQFSGTIEPSCKVKGNGSATASTLVIDQGNSSQDIGTLEVWCNTGRNATTRYASANNGFLVDGNNKVAYTLDVGNSAQNIDLSSNFTDNNTQAQTGNTGTAAAHQLKITPQSNGLDAAGQYSDTITVTVSYN